MNRFIIDPSISISHIIDTRTDKKYDFEEVVEVLNSLNDKNNELQDSIDKYRDDNTRYSLNVDEPIEVENPRFKKTGCDTEIKDTFNNHYYWLELKENVEAIIDLLNELHEDTKRVVFDREQYIDTINDLQSNNKRLTEENKWLKTALKYNDVDWLRDNTVWEIMPSKHKTYTITSNDIKKEGIDELLEDIRHELASISKWYAFEPTKYINTEKDYTIINNEEFLIQLDFEDLIRRIDKELDRK